MGKKLGYYYVKIFDIFLLSVYYFVFGSILSVMLDKSIPDENPQNISTWLLICQCLVIFGVIGIGFYFLKILVQNIPFVLDGVYGYKHFSNGHILEGVIIAYIIFTFQEKLLARLQELKSRFQLLSQHVYKVYKL